MCAAKLQRPLLAFYPSMCSVEFQWILFAYVVLHLKRYDGFPWLTPQKISVEIPPMFVSFSWLTLLAHS